MKKKFSLVMLFVLLAALLLVSCNPESGALDETIDVSLTGLNRTERSLDSKLEAFDSQSLDWKYKATKKDNSGFTTGEKTEETLLPENGSIGAISQGYWEFSLFGYKNSTLVYEGKTEARVVKGSNNTKITILVAPKQTESGKGTLLVDGSILKNGNYKVVVSLKGVTDTSFTNSSNFDVVNGSLSGDMRITNLPAGSYSVEVSFVNTDDNGTITYVKEPVVVNIYDSLETIVYGSVSETLENVTLTPTAEGSVIATTEKAFDSTQKTTITINSSPLSEEKSTEIVIPKDTTLEDENGNSITTDKLKLEVTTHPVTSSIILSSDNFTVEDDKSVVAALDINLSAGDKVVKSFGGEKVTITTYIAKGLSNVAVKYNGDGAQPDAVPNYETDAEWTSANTETGYSKESGKLTFTTTHFSSYYVVTDLVVAVDSEGNVYSTLKSALESGNDVTLIKDLTLNDVTVSLENDLTLNLNEKTLTLTDSGFVLSKSNTLYNVLVKDGTIEGNYNSNSSAFTINSGASLKLDNVNLNYSVFDAVIYIEYGANPAKLVVEDSTIKNNGYYCIATNANEGTDFLTLTIDNSTIEAINTKSDEFGDSTAILINVPSNISIKNSTVTGDRQGIVLRGGVADIVSSVVKTTAKYSNNKFYLDGYWLQGNEVPAAAITVGRRVSSENYAYPTTLTYDSNTSFVVADETKTNFFPLYAYQDSAQYKVTINGIVLGKNVSFYIEDGFYVVSDATSLKPLFKNAKVEKVKLGKDINLTSQLVAPTSKKVLDLNGYTLSSDFRDGVIKLINGADLTITGNGTIKENNPNIAPILVKGSLTNSVKLTVKDGVTLEGWAGVFVDQNINKNKGINVELDNITINAKDDLSGDNGLAIYVNGEISEKTDYPVIKVKNSTLNSTGNGIYAAGNADWTLDNNTINAAITGIEIRAGKMTINSGSTSTSASSFSYEANDNGTTTEGAALVVSQHNSVLPINVTINGGTFSGPVKLAVVNTIGDKLSNVTVNTNNKIDSADIRILPEGNFEMADGVIINCQLASDAVSFEKLFNDASANYVKLSNDISLSGKSVSFSSGNKIIDLGGNTLTLDSGTFDVVIADGSSFAIVNGTVKLPTAETSTIKPIDLNKGGKLYLKNVTFDTDDTTLSCFFDCSDSQSELYLKNSVKENNAYKTSFRLFKNVLNHSTFNFNFDLYSFENGKYEKKTSAVNNYLLDVSWS